MKLREHITEILAGIAGTISALAVGDIVSATTAAKLGVAAAILTIWRGIIETAQLKGKNRA